MEQQLIFVGISRGLFGRAVVSDTKGLQFESSHQQISINNIFTVNYWKDEKRGLEWPLF